LPFVLDLRKARSVYSCLTGSEPARQGKKKKKADLVTKCQPKAGHFVTAALPLLGISSQHFVFETKCIYRKN
jgi:hypothetical protein